MVEGMLKNRLIISDQSGSIFSYVCVRQLDLINHDFKDKVIFTRPPDHKLENKLKSTFQIQITFEIVLINK